MGDKEKFLAFMVMLAAVVGLLVLLIDFKIKNDLIQTAIKVDADLQKIQVFTGTAVPKNSEAAAENGHTPVSNWAGHLRRGDVLDHAPVVETRGRFAEPETEATEATESIVPETGDGNSGIQAED